MTNWQDKYKDLEVGQSAWYWHKDKKGEWYAVKVERVISMQDGYPVLISNSIHCDRSGLVFETFPNGPKCLTPDEVEELENKVEKLESEIEVMIQEQVGDDW